MKEKEYCQCEPFKECQTCHKPSYYAWFWQKADFKQQLEKKYNEGIEEGKKRQENDTNKNYTTKKYYFKQKDKSNDFQKIPKEEFTSDYFKGYKEGLIKGSENVRADYRFAINNATIKGGMENGDSLISLNLLKKYLNE